MDWPAIFDSTRLKPLDMSINLRWHLSKGVVAEVNHNYSHRMLRTLLKALKLSDKVGQLELVNTQPCGKR